MSANVRCEEARDRLAELAEAEGQAGPVDAALARHADSCPACRQELRLLRRVLDAAGSVARSGVPEPSGAYWESFLPSVRTRLSERTGASSTPSTGRLAGRPMAKAAMDAAATLMLAAAGAAVLAPPARPGELAALRQAGERMERAMRPDPRLSGVSAADLLGIDPAQEIEPGELLEALREIAPPPALTGTWSGIEDGDLESSIDRLDKERTRQLLTELSAARG